LSFLDYGAILWLEVLPRGCSGDPEGFTFFFYGENGSS